jgi:hypothetical protein
LPPELEASGGPFVSPENVRLIAEDETGQLAYRFGRIQIRIKVRGAEWNRVLIPRGLENERDEVRNGDLFWRAYAIALRGERTSRARTERVKPRLRSADDETLIFEQLVGA